MYRDLKPSNVMLGRNGQVKLIDFGIARFFLPQSNATMIGTQGYAPPEQYRGRAEARSDLYALGATMHHALSGRDPAAEPPFSFPKLKTLCPDINPALAELVDQALEYDVVHRMADAAEFKERLLAIKSGRRDRKGQRSDDVAAAIGQTANAIAARRRPGADEIRARRCHRHFARTGRLALSVVPQERFPAIRASVHFAVRR